MATDRVLRAQGLRRHSSAGLATETERAAIWIEHDSHVRLGLDLRQLGAEARSVGDSWGGFTTDVPGS